MSIGNKIKEYRKKSGLTQKEFAKQIDKSERMLQKYENGEVTPSINIVYKMAEKLGINFLQLITGEDNPDDEKKANAIFEFANTDEDFYDSVNSLNLDLGSHFKKTLTISPLFQMSQEFLGRLISHVEEKDKSKIEGLNYITVKEIDYFLTISSKYIQYLIEKHNNELIPDSEKLIKIE